MRNTVFCFALGWLLIAVPGWGQPLGVRKGEVVKLAPGVAPRVGMATAVEKGGEVLVRISMPAIRLKDTDPADKSVSHWMYCWEEDSPLTLGREVQAYSPGGKKLDKGAVVKALARPAAVACFARLQPNDPEQPDPVYARVFRDDVVLLVFKAKYWLR